MRIAIVSDIHGNLTALEAVVADLRRRAPDLILQGGDLAASGARPAEVVDRIRELGWAGVCGNTDEMLWAPERLSDLARKHPQQQGLWRVVQEIAARTREWLGEERINWLQSIPREVRRHPVALVHASPGDLWVAPSFEASDAELGAAYRSLAAPVVAYGHIHRPFVRKVGSQIVANTGSVSLSHDSDPRASYLLIDDLEVTVQRVEYDVEREAAALLDSGLPQAEWLCALLRAAQPLPLPEPSD
ncbi:MAG TPA: metallophosphoesterase family protein [Thermoanaerobaculia bacterium]|nr:metallophosphoesterase family protein [Thermoanaerobaculia bacterium]